MERLIYENIRGGRVDFFYGSPYHIVIEGVIGLSDTNVETYGISGINQDGETRTGQRIMSREIELSGQILELDDFVADAHRRTLSRTLNPHIPATLTYEKGNFRRSIKCTPIVAPSYTKRKPLDFQQFTIQLDCASPFWYDDSENRTEVAGVDSLFEFPIALPTSREWEISRRKRELIVNVFNGGDVDTGMRVEFLAIGKVINPFIVNATTLDRITFNVIIDAGDVITIWTGFGEKNATLKRSGSDVHEDALRILDFDSKFLQLSVGDNLIAYGADENDENLHVTIFHNNRYLSV